MSSAYAVYVQIRACKDRGGGSSKQGVWLVAPGQGYYTLPRLLLIEARVGAEDWGHSH